LKLRQILECSDVEKALAAISGSAIQDKIDKEHEQLMKYLAQEQKKANRKEESSIVQDQHNHNNRQGSKTISLQESEVLKFQAVQPDPEPELEGLERASINVDDHSFPQIFPERHV
ncbi:hypothetical protein BGW38_003152, partial [Lunasporangiospora selenospora]